MNTHGSFIIGIGVVGLYLCAGLFSFQLGSVQAIAWTRKQRLQLETALLFCLAGLADHAVWNATRRVSLRYGVFTAHQRRQRK